MARYGLHTAHLSLAHSQQIFLITIIDLDLPPIKARLHQLLDGSSEIGSQEVSGLPIVSTRVQGKLIGHRSNYNKSQRSQPPAPLPQHAFHLFISHHAELPAQINLGFVPGNVRLQAHLLRGEKLWVIFATQAWRCGQAQPGILAAAGEQVGALQGGPEHRLVREATITHNQQGASIAATLVEAGAQTAQYFQCLHREILLFLQLAILSALFLISALARLLHGWSFLKADRDATGWMIAFAVVWKQQRGLQEAQAVNQIYMEGRRERIALPTGTWDLLPCLTQIGVVN